MDQHTSTLPEMNDLSKAVRKRTRSILKPEQQEVLIKALDAETFPSRRRREELAAEIGCNPRTVQIWFQNQRQKARKVHRASRVTPWSSPLINCHPPPPPPPSPSLSYSGSERSPALNCLVDAAMEELCKVSISIKDSQPSSPRLVPDLPPSRRRVRRQERIEIKKDDGVSALLRALPASLLKSPKLVKSEQGSPKIKLLQPKSQPNTNSDRAGF